MTQEELPSTLTIDKSGRIIARPSPVETKLNHEYLESLRLSAAMTEVLKAAEPDFQMWTIADFPPKRVKYYPYSRCSLPNIVKADFNGDGKEDAVVSGHDKTCNLILGIISGESGYKLVLMRRRVYYDSQYGKIPPYTPDITICFHAAGSEFTSGDSYITKIKLPQQGVTEKTIVDFSYKKRVFYESDVSTYDIELHLWDKNRNQFGRTSLNTPDSRVFDEEF